MTLRDSAASELGKVALAGITMLHTETAEEEKFANDAEKAIRALIETAARWEEACSAVEQRFTDCGTRLTQTQNALQNLVHRCRNVLPYADEDESTWRNREINLRTWHEALAQADAALAERETT